MNSRWLPQKLAILLLLPIGGAVCAPAQVRDRDSSQQSKPILFTSQDRDAMNSWYRAHRNELPAEFVAREHWSPTFEGRLHVGSVVEKDIRQWAYPMPEDLLSRLPAQPRHYRYVVIGEHACIIDAAWRLYDVHHFHG
ncbi:MAG TPA: hypothetical protein VFO34_04830 [Candidatus Acidoferrales bacterium]|nr:hypothetical protein [Candidatus Acidoferrales bacterium]